MPTRREFLSKAGALASGIVSLLPFTARPGLAQNGHIVPKVGYLEAQLSDFGNSTYRAFEHGLHDLGYVEGRTIEIVRKFGANDPSVSEALTRELIAEKVDVIFAPSTIHVRGALAVTHAVPIVFAAAADPVGEGFVASLAHPGGNATGFSQMYAEFAAKPIELLKEALPTARRVVLLRNPTKNPDGSAAVVTMENALGKLGLDYQLADASGPADFERSYAGFDAIALVDDVFFSINSRLLMRQAMMNRLPVIGAAQGQAEAGCLISYYPDLTSNFRGAATYVDKILRGAKPGDLPVQQPTRFFLAVNLKTAKSLDLTIPTSLLLLADNIIE